MTWRNPQLTAAAHEWRTAQCAVIQARRVIRVLDEECSSPAPARASAGDVAILEARANQALSECLRITRQASRASVR
ncbi:hypothetical protein ACPWT1_20205 [Ramlibacter sp. MMS24-I3-19]|uniref:hypothetical protein n=1 Tax=Ramlibacter sp. MMS24-I3-19 TaxID=3416606 RepID=UPI003D00E097